MTNDYKTYAAHIGRFLLNRSQERSSVAGFVAAVTAMLGIAVLPGETTQIVSTIVAIGGAVAALVPGGK